MISKHLNRFQIRGILKAGQVLAPGSQRLPSFSSDYFIHEIDRILEFMTSEDLNGFRFLMTLFSILPPSSIKSLLLFAEKSSYLPNFLQPPFRLINFGVKGVIYTMYYSDTTADQKIKTALDWKTKCGPQSAPIETAEKAMQQSKIAFQQIRKLSLSERLDAIRRLKTTILQNQNLIIDSIQKATGKSRSDALMSEIFPILDHFNYLEKFAPRILRDRKVHTPLPLLGKKSRVYFEPLGPVLIICPWNYPFYQAIVPITSAFICGNSVLYKPSEYTPLTGLLEDLFTKASWPTTWVQPIYGDGAMGSALIEQKPSKIFFIGSTQTGKKIMAQAAPHLIPVELELGGKDPMIVFEDADLSRSVAGGLWGAMTNTGQSCTSVERLYVQEQIYEDYRDLIVHEAKQITQSVDVDGSADIGEMTNDEQTATVARHIEDAIQKGAKLLTGNQWDRKSRKIPPLILENVTEDMLVMTEETFGPVLPLIPFQTEEDVLGLANKSFYGLSASVWTKDLKRADRVARKLETGNVSINNVMLTEGNHALPFGGIKQSGFGRFKGEFGFYSFSNIKSIIVDSNSSKIEANWYPYTKRKYSLFEGMMQGAFGKGLTSLVKFAKNGLQMESHAAKEGKRREQSISN